MQFFSWILFIKLTHADESLESLWKRTDDTNRSFRYAADDVPEPEEVTYTDYNDPLSFLKLPSDTPHIRTLSSNAWIAIGEEKFILECLGKGYIKIELMKDDAGQCLLQLNLGLYDLFLSRK